MTAQTPYKYQVFSQPRNNMTGLYPYIDSIASAYMRYYENSTLVDERACVRFQIDQGWSGLVMAFDERSPIGFMNFFKTDSNSTYKVGFTYVDHGYRDKKVWSAMSDLVEEEVKSMGGHQLNREIDSENSFLIPHLEAQQYKLLTRNSELDYFPLAKRL